jgi:hypothetical protein
VSPTYARTTCSGLRYPGPSVYLPANVSAKNGHLDHVSMSTNETELVRERDLGVVAWVSVPVGICSSFFLSGAWAELHHSKSRVILVQGLASINLVSRLVLRLECRY